LRQGIAALLLSQEDKAWIMPKIGVRFFVIKIKKMEKAQKKSGNTGTLSPTRIAA